MLPAQTIVASAARTTSSNSAAFSVRDQDEKGIGLSNLNVVVDVTAASGTGPSLALEVEWSVDGTTFGAADGSADTFAAITAAGVKAKRVSIKAPFYRLKWTITGTTPSFTFSASALPTA